jgi:hypothetical protein
MRKEILSNLILLCAILLFGVGCGDDDGGGGPAMSVNVSPHSASIEIGRTISIEAEVSGGSSGAVDWYVNDMYGGSSVVGTITQTNPATYTAPGSVPSPEVVVVKAVSQDDASEMDNCTVTITFTVVHVSAAQGSDETGTGAITDPVKSITRGLEIAQAGMTVLVASGTYDVANGEVFPIALTDSIALVGQDRDATIISGHSETSGFYDAVTLSGDRCAFRKFRVIHEGAPAGIWAIVVSVYDTCRNAHIDSMMILESFSTVALRITGAEGTIVENCVFSHVGDPLYRGIEDISDASGTVVRNCAVTGFYYGIFFNSFSDALVEGCTLESNAHGLYLCCLADPDDKPNPDLGGGARGSAGGNVIVSSTVCGLTNLTPNTVYAKFNTWSNDPPIDGVDFCNDSTGEVIWE